ncbi:MAG TPA: SDR family NAD(P)-dependent oxidoreductase [Solirubrobacterales bacterium]|jgi:short-subunit dehydrogenase
MTADYRTALVTGASSGIGRALALWLAARGTTVYAAGRRAERLQALRDEAARGGGRIEPVVLDVGDVEAVRACVRELDGVDGGLDLVVANAGFGAHTPATDFRWDLCEKVVRVNVLGAAATLAAALPGMVERDRGHLVAIASLAAFRGLPKDAAYGASKAFLRSFMESLRVDLQATNVRTTCIFPGFVKSEMTAHNTFRMPFLLETDAAAARIGRAILAGKAQYSFPWQLAAFVHFLRVLPTGLYDRIARRMNPTRARSGSAPR